MKHIKKIIKDFNIPLDELEQIFNKMDSHTKNKYDCLMCNMSILAMDASKDSYNKFTTAIKGLGRIDSNEVITPNKIVNKMINKLPKEDYKKAERILLVNEKQCEFLNGLIEKFGPDIAKKCLIVPSSEIGKHLCMKMLKSMNLNDYIIKEMVFDASEMLLESKKNSKHFTQEEIDSMMMKLDDLTGDNKTNINDFLEMNNNDILKMNNGKKFDICLMNPPYDGSSHGDQFYVKFINKVVNVSKQLVIISPDNAFLSKSKVKNKELRANINKFKPELNINNWEGFDAFPTSNGCISVWNTEHPNDKIKVGKHLFDTQEEIIINDNEYLSEFFEKLNKFMKTHDSIYDKCVANPKNNQYMDPNGRRKVQEKWTDDNTWFTVFPYCIASFFTTFGVEQYSDKLWNGPARILVPFDNKEYAQNCYNTIHKNGGKKGDLIDFFTLISKALTKSLYIKSTEQYKYFPFLDFSKTYSNEELFKMIGMEYNEEEINKILNNKFQNLR